MPGGARRGGVISQPGVHLLIENDVGVKNVSILCFGSSLVVVVTVTGDSVLFRHRVTPPLVSCRSPAG